MRANILRRFSRLGLAVATLSLAATAVMAPVSSVPASAASVPGQASGYWLMASDGGIFSYGDAPFYGSTGAIKLNKPIVGMAATPSGAGYWLVASDGGIFSYGDAAFQGSTGAIKLNQPIVGMTATPTGGGYWLLAADGGVFAFGDADGTLGSAAGRAKAPVVAMAATPSGHGYWVGAQDGSVFAFGDAFAFGSTPKLNRPIVGMTATPTGRGYWLVASDGGIFSFGDATFHGSTGAMTLNKPIVGMAATSTGKGYWLVASDGGIFSFGDSAFYGSTGAMTLNKPIVGMAHTVPLRLSKGDFGTTVDPYHVDDWSAAVGAKPSFVMQYEAWSQNRTLDPQFAAVRQQGVDGYMVTWEPWQPVPASAGMAAQAAVQPAYSNATIAAGGQDSYIRAFARSVKNSGLRVVYIRYAHEMNGNWYPWSNDPTAYKAAWRHIVDIFRQEGAGNARFVYSTNPNMYQSDAAWTAGFWNYWPGADVVDYVGSTAINLFGGTDCVRAPCAANTKNYPISLLATRLTAAHILTGKPMFITEFNTVAAGRAKWLQGLHDWVMRQDWVSGVTLSQSPSRAQAQASQAGDLSWQVDSDPETQPIIRSIIRDLTS